MYDVLLREGRLDGRCAWRSATGSGRRARSLASSVWRRQRWSHVRPRDAGRCTAASSTRLVALRNRTPLPRASRVAARAQALATHLRRRRQPRWWKPSDATQGCRQRFSALDAAEGAPRGSARRGNGDLKAMLVGDSVPSGPARGQASYGARRSGHGGAQQGRRAESVTTTATDPGRGRGGQAGPAAATARGDGRAARLYRRRRKTAGRNEFPRQAALFGRRTRRRAVDGDGLRAFPHVRAVGGGGRRGALARAGDIHDPRGAAGRPRPTDGGAAGGFKRRRREDIRAAARRDKARS